jgi:acyl-CoA reductase-like NAD-dependent aldehyde dehydrogenase
VAHLFIDGQWVSPEVPAAAEILNPFDASVLAAEAVVPRGVVNLVTGSGRTAGAALVEDSWSTWSPSPAAWTPAGRSCGPPPRR